MAHRPVRRPNFFIVGAPKSGTTAMNDYLRAHPDVFIPPVKELHYFGGDLTFRFTPRLTEAEYLAYFRGARDQRRVGEASVRYLQSASAAAEIRRFAPDARIIAMLRNPIDMMYAMHSELVFSGMEDIEDFAAALDAESDRSAGRRLPRGTNVPEMLLYRRSGRYAEQLERYFDAFGRERVHVVLQDDFLRDSPQTYRRTLAFLEVDPDFQPLFRIVNPSKTVRSRIVRSVVASPPHWLRRVARATISRPGRKRIYKGVLRLNARAVERRPMDPDLRRSLLQEFTPEIERLSVLLSHDLSQWSAS